MLNYSPDDVAFAVEVPAGTAGVKETLKLMRKVVRAYRRYPPIIQVAQSLVSVIPEKNWLDEIVALHRFVRDEIRYTLDVNEVEVLQTPERLLRTRQGDCDDKATLLATLLEAVGHPARFVAVGQIPGELSHVLVEAKVGDQWLPLETTEPVEAGWFPPDVTTIYPVHI